MFTCAFSKYTLLLLLFLVFPPTDCKLFNKIQVFLSWNYIFFAIRFLYIFALHSKLFYFNSSFYSQKIINHPFIVSDLSVFKNLNKIIHKSSRFMYLLFYYLTLSSATKTAQILIKSTTLFFFFSCELNILFYNFLEWILEIKNMNIYIIFLFYWKNKYLLCFYLEF